MRRDQLKAWLEAGFSLDRMGELAARHPSTVSYWLKKYDLVPNGRAKHAAKGALDRKRLGTLVDQGRSIRSIARELDVSASTVRHWLNRYGLPQPIEVRHSDLNTARAQGERTVMRECRRHGSTVFVIENSGRARCRRCRVEAVATWRRRTKKRLVDEAGGACVLCGYDRNQAVLQFHHLDPTQKEFGLAMGGLTRSLAELRREAGKCVLLCANCHAEVEIGAASLSEIDAAQPSCVVARLDHGPG